MEQLLKDMQEICLEKLTVTGGKELEMLANINSPEQMDLVLMGNIYGRNGLRSRYFGDQKDSLLRLTCSYQGRCRSDIVEIGKSVRFPMQGFGGLSNGDLQ